MTAPTAPISFARLGNYSFRINPSQIFVPYEVNSTVIPTIGGRVVQVYGVTTGDLTVQGLFGEDRAAGKPSWDLAREFQAAIAQMVQTQSRPPTPAQLQGTDATPINAPIRFVYQDAKHNFDFMVYIKSLKDVADGGFVVSHETGKYSYGYTLTLFIVNDNSGKLTQVATDQFIARLSAGLGWKRTPYNGPMTKAELQAYLQANSPQDPTLHGLVLKEFNDAAQGTIYAGQGNGTLPGAAAVANAPLTPGNTTVTPSGDSGTAPAAAPKPPNTPSNTPGALPGTGIVGSGGSGAPR